MRRKITKQRLTDSCQAGTVCATYSDFQKPVFAHSVFMCFVFRISGISWLVCVMQENVQGGSNMTGTDLCVNKPHKNIYHI
jgi:hypothetical protein